MFHFPALLFHCKARLQHRQYAQYKYCTVRQRFLLYYILSPSVPSRSILRFHHRLHIFPVFSALLLPNFSATGYCLSSVFNLSYLFSFAARFDSFSAFSRSRALFSLRASHTLCPFSSFLSRVFRHLEHPALFTSFLRLCVHMVIPYTTD